MVTITLYARQKKRHWCIEPSFGAKSRTWLSDFTFTFHFHALEKEIGNPLQCSCLENPRDGEDWWAAVSGVAQSQTRLKRLSSSSSSVYMAVRIRLHFHFHFLFSCIGEGNGNPLQCSCLENPRDGEDWWAAVYRVAQSRTRLKRLSSSSSRAVARQAPLSMEFSRPAVNCSSLEETWMLH